MQKMHMFNNPEFGEVRTTEESGKFLFCGTDIATALGYTNPRKAVRDHTKGGTKRSALTDGGSQQLSFITEGDVYRLIARSKLPSAEQFETWLFDEVLPSLCKAAGLEAWEAFRMMDKEHQKKCMDIIHGFKEPTKVNYIKANTIADKAVSIKYGLPKMIKKSDMTPDMLVDRQEILDSTVSLMRVNDEFNLGLSVSTAVYGNVVDCKGAGR